MQMFRQRPIDGIWTFDVSPLAVEGWLRRLWWTAAAIDGVVVIAAMTVRSGVFPLGRIAPLLAAGALINVELALRTGRGDEEARWVSAAALMLRIALLTSLLELSGGPSNPFAVIYVVQVALAAVTLGRAWAYLGILAAFGCYGLLVSWHMEEAVPAHHRFVDFPTHIYAMWLATSTLAEFAMHFAGAASRAIARREQLLDDARAQTARAERLMSMTTLAAGAAHELSTPLATIAIASKELERTLAHLPVPAECAGDAHLIRSEVDRCQLILDEMSGRAGGSAAEEAAEIAIDDLVADIRARLPAELRERLTVHAPTPSRMLVRRAGLVQVLLSLIKNAFDASSPSMQVALSILRKRNTFTFEIQDHGSGMTPDVLRRAGEPFFTTKDAGRGYGLGLFLARVFAERAGGELAFESDAGTRVVLTLPDAEDEALTPAVTAATSAAGATMNRNEAVEPATPICAAT